MSLYGLNTVNQTSAIILNDTIHNFTWFENIDIYIRILYCLINSYEFSLQKRCIELMNKRHEWLEILKITIEFGPYRSPLKFHYWYQ